MITCGYELLEGRAVLWVLFSDIEKALVSSQVHFISRDLTQDSKDCSHFKHRRAPRSVQALSLVVSLWWNPQSPILRTFSTSLEAFYDNGAHCDWTWPVVNSWQQLNMHAFNHTEYHLSSSQTFKSALWCHKNTVDLIRWLHLIRRSIVFEHF